MRVPRHYFPAAICVSIFYAVRRYRSPMEKLLTSGRSHHSPRPSHARSSAYPVQPAAQDGWADGETRAFIERPYHFTLPVRVLGVVLFLAAAVALANIAWILANHI